MPRSWPGCVRSRRRSISGPDAALRTAFLADACAGDEDLPREVQSLLDQASMPGFLPVPRLDVVLAANLQHVSGKPWAATTQASLPQGDQRILLETRGSQRLPTQSLVDFRVSRRFHIRDGASVDLMFDVLNLSNETAEEAIASDNAFAANFGVGTVFVDPRRIMVSVRLNMGR